MNWATALVVCFLAAVVAAACVHRRSPAALALLPIVWGVATIVAVRVLSVRSATELYPDGRVDTGPFVGVLIAVWAFSYVGLLLLAWRNKRTQLCAASLAATLVPSTLAFGALKASGCEGEGGLACMGFIFGLVAVAITAFTGGWILAAIGAQGPGVTNER